MKRMPLLDPISRNLDNPAFWEMLYEIERKVLVKFAFKYKLDVDDLTAESQIMDKLVVAVKGDTYTTLPDEKENYAQFLAYFVTIANNEMQTKMNNLSFAKVKRQSLEGDMESLEGDPFAPSTNYDETLDTRIKEGVTTMYMPSGRPNLRGFVYKAFSMYGTDAKDNGKVREYLVKHFPDTKMPVIRITISHLRKALGVERKHGKGQKLSAWGAVKKYYVDGMRLGEFQRILAPYTDSANSVSVYFNRIKRMRCQKKS